VTERDGAHPPPGRATGLLAGLLEWPDGVARLGAAACALVAAAFALVYLVDGVDRLGDQASRNAALSYADREIAGGNSILVDQLAAYQARAILPLDEPYKVATGGGMKETTPLTLGFVASWFRYFLMPRRPAESARWVICYGCDTSALPGRFEERWHDDVGISIGRLVR
jgi:hypothetical protein